MGGSVSVTLRKSDGTEYRMSRWTNSLSWGICNLRMLNGDEDHINAYLEQWLMMKEDYERNKDTKQFKHAMTSCYFPSEGLVPDGYGLVVVDHVNKVILDMQGYTSFDNIHALSIALERRKSNDKDSETSIFKEFFEAGKIKGVDSEVPYNRVKPLRR